MTVQNKFQQLGQDIRHLMRGCDRANLAVTLSNAQDTNHNPYVALVLAAFDHDGAPLLFISDLAEHTKALRENPVCSLLLDGTTGRRDPLTGARVTLQGEASFLSGEAKEYAKSRYIRRHPSAAIYANFSDFHIVKIIPSRAHLVAGFGKIHWLDWTETCLSENETSSIQTTDNDITQHMNEDHSDVVNLIANKILKLKSVGWQISAVDADGCDLFLNGEHARYNFSEPAYSPDAIRNCFIQSAKQARSC